MRNNATLLVIAAFGLILGSCSGEDPTTLNRPPVVRSFEPTDHSVNAFVGDTLQFEVNAFHPDQASIKQRFTLNDSLVSDHFRWDYVIPDTGIAYVECLVTDGAYDTRIEWEVAQLERINLPPEIVAHSPIESHPVMIIDHEMEFAIRANDPEGEPLKYEFSVDEKVVAETSEYLFQATEIGTFDIEAKVSDSEHSAVRYWQLTVTPVPDTIPPAEVVINMVEKGDEPGEIRVEWVAVGADGLEGKASNYEVRTSPSPIIDEDTWTRATNRPGVPAALESGEVMSMVVRGLTPAHFTYVAVRALDAFGNLSPLGTVPGLFARGMRISGKVMDALTGLPMENAYVNLVSYRTRTDADGNFEFQELPPLNALLVVSDDNILSILGAYYDMRMPYEVVHNDYLPIYLIPDYQLDTTQYPDFYAFFVIMTEITGSPYPHHQRRWEAPIDIYARPFENEGLDFQATIHEVALELNTAIGMDLFNVVDGDPPVGVFCHYPQGLIYDNYGVRQWSEDWFPVVADIEFRRAYTPASENQFRRIIRHELGHALGLNHSLDPNHLMRGGTAPERDSFTDDETALIRVLYHVPRGTPVSYYVRD
ncbi:MAG: carboxypeptidase regulatory-like domain-containing protein [Candidatus Latescibacterota bacterium]